tara:strand:- start:1752 stop:2336 length:585 start_codon:yes stop_codon:yes gene_type:complete
MIKKLKITISIYTIIIFFSLTNFSYAKLVQIQHYKETIPCQNYIKISENINNQKRAKKANLAFVKKNNITIKNSYVRAIIGKSNNTAAYMEILSSSDDYLLKATVKNAKKVEFHSTYLDSKKIMRMKKIKKLKIEKNNILKLKPGGLHIMIMGLILQLNEGDNITINLFFEKAGIVNVTLPAISILNSKPQHKH